MQKELTIITKDFNHIHATEYKAESSNGITVIINSAMAVKQSFYSEYANFLASEGFQVITYDYQGIGKSKKQPLSKMETSIIDWATQDYEAVLLYAKETYPKNSITVLGHSIGGQLIGFSERSVAVEQFMLIASQTPYWKNYRNSTKPKLLMLWYFLIPFFTRVFRFFPASYLGLFENLPKSAALQWMRWARSRDYAFTELPEKIKTFEKLQQPCLAISFSDDTYAPEKAVNNLLGYYKNLNIEHWQLSPEDIAMDSIGHFGFFKKRFKNTLWASSAKWLKKGGKVKMAV